MLKKSFLFSFFLLLSTAVSAGFGNRSIGAVKDGNTDELSSAIAAGPGILYPYAKEDIFLQSAAGRMRLNLQNPNDRILMTPEAVKK